MDEGTTTALFGLFGTLIGGLITWAGQWHNARVERQREEQRQIVERQQHREELRRQAYLRFLGTADEFQESARDITQLISMGQDGDGRVQAEERYLVAWRALDSSLAEVQLAGPQGVSDSAGRLYNAAAEYSNAVDTYLRKTRHSSKEDEARESLRDVLLEARKAFPIDARRAIESDS